jgi:hypothetical protein
VSVVTVAVPELLDADRCTLFIVEGKELVVPKGGSKGRDQTNDSMGLEGDHIPMNGIAGCVRASHMPAYPTITQHLDNPHSTTAASHSICLLGMWLRTASF